MTEPTFIPESERELIAVYPDDAHAQQARTALLDVGVQPEEIHLSEEGDIVAALRAEMSDEMTRSLVAPHAGVVYPPGSARGFTIIGLVGAVIGIAAAFPLALIDFGSTYWVRWLVWAVVGVGFGFAVGVVAGPAGGAPRPGELSPAARGTVLRVERDAQGLRRILESFEPLRLDEISHGGDPIDNIYTSMPTDTAEVAKDIAANVQGDDYNPER